MNLRALRYFVAIADAGSLTAAAAAISIAQPALTRQLRELEADVNTIVYDSVARFEGSISAEHGVGSLKLDKLEHHKSPVALGMMRAIKLALDPAGLLNPGRVIRL